MAEVSRSPVSLISHLPILMYEVFSFFIPVERNSRSRNSQNQIPWNDVFSFYLVSKCWYTQISNKQVWKAIRGLVCTLPQNNPFTTPHNDPKKIQPMSKMFSPSQLANPLVPFQSLYIKSTGSEGTLTVVKEKCSTHLFAMKVVRLTDNTVPYHVLREIATLKSLSIRMNENISSIDEVAFVDGNLHLFHKYMDTSLDKVLSTNGGLPKNQVKSLTEQLLNGCYAMHKQGVMHRNLKPIHLVLQTLPNNEYKLKIADFALVRVNSFPRRQFSPDVITMWYRCPEILMGESMYSTSVDMWSVGCIVAEMLLGRPLFRGKTEIGQLFKIFQTLGTPEFDQFEKYVNFSKFKFPSWKKSNIESLFARIENNFPHENRFLNDNGKRVHSTSSIDIDVSSPISPTTDSNSNTHLFDLIEKLLECDPRKRISAKKSLQHKYINPSANFDPNQTSNSSMGSFDDPKMVQRDNNKLLNRYKINENRPRILKSHRAILIDWLIEVGDVLDASSRTIFIAVNLFDKFYELQSQKVRIESGSYQMIGATCLHIASKCEEVTYISTKDLIYCCDNKYEINDIVRTERILLQTLSFKINDPTVFDFVSVFVSFTDEFNNKSSALKSQRLTLTAHFIAEIVLHGSAYVKYPPSLIATCVVSLTLYIKNECAFPRNLEIISRRKFGELKDCFEEIWRDCVEVQTGMHGWDVIQLGCVKKKYEKQERLCVAKDVIFKRNFMYEEIEVVRGRGGSRSGMAISTAVRGTGDESNFCTPKSGGGSSSGGGIFK
ncbi:hypothetical protein ScalyP_jg7755 [Parmales sp. scaly parma]|nr:hypothetical protein ScalyP_jg7755 [Parmales sp. scaly parma]